MKKRFTKQALTTLFTSAIILSSVAGTAVTFAQDYDALINESQATINSLSAQQANLYNELALGYQALDALQAEATELLTNLAEDEKQITELNKQITELQELIAKREELLADQARAVQANGGTTNYLSLVASAESISDFVGRLDIVRKMVTSNKDLLTTQKEDKEAVEAKQAQVEEAKSEKIAKQVELEALKAGLEEQQANNEMVYQALTEDISLAAANRDALIAEKQAYEEQQAIIRAQQLAAQQAAAEAAAAQAAAVAAQAAADQALAEANQAAQVAETAQANAETIEAQPTPAVNTEETPSDLEVLVETTEAVQDLAVEETIATEVTEVVTEVAAELTTEVVEVTELPVETLVSEETVAPIVEEVTTVDTAAQQAEAQAAQAAAEAEAEAEAARIAAEEAAQAAATAQEQAVAAQANASTLLANAAQYLGTPYVWGGKTPAGFDCSGFVQYVFQQTYGINVGGWTGAQESAGTQISVSEAQAGDLYFWGSPGGTYHVAIATGDGGYIHASQPGTPLEYNNISNFTPTFALRVNLN